MKYIKLMILSSLILFFSCSGKYDRKVITSNNNQNESITIIRKGSQYLIYNGIVNLDSIPENGYIINEGVIEYFNALANWDDGKVIIYHTYGSFNESNNQGDIVLKRISVKEFEKLKDDPANTYFYY